MSRRILLAAALALAWATALPPGRAVAAEKIVLQLDRPAQFEFAGYYAALWQGYYRAAGLEVVIRPGAPPGRAPIDPVREVTEGRARFGTGSARLLIRDAQGLPLLLVAPIFQSSGAMVYYRAGSDFSSPGALLKARIGRLPASDILDIELRTALHAEGIDIDKLHSVPIKPGGAVAALADNTVDAVIGSAWRLPWQAHERGLALKSFDPAVYRPEFYGDSLFTLQRFAKAEPQTVARFRAATLKGWEYALAHPDAMAARMVAELPPPPGISDPAGFARYQAGLARRLTRYPAVPLGHSNPQRWRHIAAAMVGVGALAQPVDLDGFLYDPGRGRGQGWTTWLRSGRRAWGAIAAAASALLLAGIGLALSRRRRALSGGSALAAAGRHPQRGPAEDGAVLAEELRGIADRVGDALDHIRHQAAMQPDIGRFCATAGDGLEHLQAVIGRLAGAAPVPAVHPAATDLNAAVMALKRAIRRRLRRGVRLRLSLLPAVPPCAAAPEAAAAVLDLVTTAANDMPRGGELIVGTRQYAIGAGAAAEMPEAAPGEYVRLTVRDSGPGLSEDGLARIFDAQATARPAVVAAQRLMRALGGFVRVESAQGVGTAVHLYFPLWGEPCSGTADPNEAAARAAE
jgi:ABC-type nitrate/sulfonate/bicarbonate transport system substrate-binding protein